MSLTCAQGRHTVFPVASAPVVNTSDTCPCVRRRVCFPLPCVWRANLPLWPFLGRFDSSLRGRLFPGKASNLTRRRGRHNEMVRPGASDAFANKRQWTHIRGLASVATWPPTAGGRWLVCRTFGKPALRVCWTSADAWLLVQCGERPPAPCPLPWVSVSGERLVVLSPQPPKGRRAPRCGPGSHQQPTQSLRETVFAAFAAFADT